MTNLDQDLTGTTVHVLQIEHKHGVDSYVHLSQQGAKEALYRYVETWWDEEVATDQPEDKDEMVERYFEIVEEESYLLGETVVQP